MKVIACSLEEKPAWNPPEVNIWELLNNNHCLYKLNCKSLQDSFWVYLTCLKEVLVPIIVFWVRGGINLQSAQLVKPSVNEVTGRASIPPSNSPCFSAPGNTHDSISMLTSGRSEIRECAWLATKPLWQTIWAILYSCCKEDKTIEECKWWPMMLQNEDWALCVLSLEDNTLFLTGMLLKQAADDRTRPTLPSSGLPECIHLYR